jgi:hypothetical protein
MERLVLPVIALTLTALLATKIVATSLYRLAEIISGKTSSY